MKMRGLFFAFLAVFLIAGVSALSLDMGTSYTPKETIITKVIGNILEPIGTTQVDLKRGHVSIPMDYDVKKLGDDYYIWLIAPENATDYSLVLTNVYTTVSGVPQKANYTQNFSVVNATSDYYVKPGFIFSSQDFSITAVLTEDVNRDISIDFPESRTVTLQPGENKIDFSIKNVQYTGLYTINFGKYKIPAYIITGKNAPAGTNLSNITITYNRTSDGENGSSLLFSPRRILRTVYTGDESTYQIRLENDGNDSITDLSVSYDRDIFSISPTIPSRLDEGETFYFNLTVNKFIGDFVDEDIRFSAGDRDFILPIEVNFTSNKTEAKFVPATPNGPKFYCEELLGKVCASGETCSLDTVETRNGACCTGTCSVVSSSGSSSWVGWIIALLVIAGIVYIYLKYRNVKSEDNPISSAGKKINP